jgi:hypothetical protein
MKALTCDLILALPPERHEPLRHYQLRLEATIARSFEDADEKQRLQLRTGRDLAGHAGLRLPVEFSFTLQLVRSRSESSGGISGRHNGATCIER